MKVYYSVVHTDVDDYLVETEFGLIQIDAISGKRLKTYDNLSDYMLSVEPESIIEVDFIW